MRRDVRHRLLQVRREENHLRRVPVMAVAHVLRVLRRIRRHVCWDGVRVHVADLGGPRARRVVHDFLENSDPSPTLKKLSRGARGARASILRPARARHGDLADYHTKWHVYADYHTKMSGSMSATHFQVAYGH